MLPGDRNGFIWQALLVSNKTHDDVILNDNQFGIDFSMPSTLSVKSQVRMLMSSANSLQNRKSHGSLFDGHGKSYKQFLDWRQTFLSHAKCHNTGSTNENKDSNGNGHDGHHPDLSLVDYLRKIVQHDSYFNFEVRFKGNADAKGKPDYQKFIRTCNQENVEGNNDTLCDDHDFCLLYAKNFYTGVQMLVGVLAWRSHGDCDCVRHKVVIFDFAPELDCELPHAFLVNAWQDYLSTTTTDGIRAEMHICFNCMKEKEIHFFCNELGFKILDSRYLCFLHKIF